MKLTTLFLWRFARFSFETASLKVRSQNFIQNTVTRQSHHIEMIQPSDGGRKRVAIVALFPRKPVLDSALTLIRSSLENDYHVIAVINSSKADNEEETWIQRLKEFPVTILRRPNIGRDFGAYQAGFRYLKELNLLSKFEWVAFANDSVFYGGASKKFLSEFFQSERDWVCAFLSFQYGLHAQSFLFKLSNKVVSQSEFCDYWNYYKPSDLRHVTISEGEFGLTKQLRRLGFTPHPLVTAQSILANEKFKEFTLSEEMALWSKYTLQEFFEKRSKTETEALFLLRAEHVSPGRLDCVTSPRRTPKIGHHQSWSGYSRGGPAISR